MVYCKNERIEAQKDEKRKLIFRAAARVFVRHGYHKTTVKEIVEEAGVSVGTFYLYYKNKEDIFEKIFDSVVNILSTISGAVIRQGEYSLVERFCRATTAALWAVEHFRDLSRIVIVEAVGLNPKLEEKRIAAMNESYLRMEKLLRSLQERELIHIPDPGVTALALEGASLNVRTYWLLSESKEPLRTCVFDLLVFYFQALQVQFDMDEVRESIRTMLAELDADPERYVSFC
ncbi:MAG: TetR/AcrR family transcriptional regulator [Eubacteriales bacterium]